MNLFFRIIFLKLLVLVSSENTTLFIQSKCTKNKNIECSLLPVDCFDCSLDNNPKAADCLYGQSLKTNCTIKNFTICKGERSFELEGQCRFCYQTPEWMHICTHNLSCRRDSPQRLHKVNCTVPDNVVCLGTRTFYKNVLCNWTSGHKWSVSLILSLTLGGFGIDRFYLGHYKEGLAKLFSFGGLGVWTLVDVILIYVGYVAPADGSLYI
ncbi:unnamed protein product [Brachionus calyciflorus]|uniref:TM2 domain-containing protein n=1 Tax=Brachionus calyciflorus TaxID=104777 RepID=A0A813Q932_9BILA|nr:unnamed protein product [Brachionus calyciflorus]